MTWRALWARLLPIAFGRAVPLPVDQKREALKDEPARVQAAWIAKDNERRKRA